MQLSYFADLGRGGRPAGHPQGCKPKHRSIVETSRCASSQAEMPPVISADSKEANLGDDNG